jgi:hypothetical protein
MAFKVVAPIRSMLRMTQTYKRGFAISEREQQCE